MMNRLVFVAMMMTCFISKGVFAGEALEGVTEYRFEDTTLVGELVGTDGAEIIVRPRPADRSLIRVRTHFVPEVLKSVEDL